MPKSDAADWLNPAEVDQGARRYVEVLRERAWLIVLCVVLGAAAAAAFSMLASRNYEATADLRLTPVSNAEPSLAGAGTLPGSPTRQSARSRPCPDSSRLLRWHVVPQSESKVACRLMTCCRACRPNRSHRAHLVAITARSPE